MTGAFKLEPPTDRASGDLGIGVMNPPHLAQNFPPSLFSVGVRGEIRRPSLQARGKKENGNEEENMTRCGDQKPIESDQSEKGGSVDFRRRKSKREKQDRESFSQLDTSDR